MTRIPLAATLVVILVAAQARAEDPQPADNRPVSKAFSHFGPKEPTREEIEGQRKAYERLKASDSPLDWAMASQVSLRAPEGESSKEWPFDREWRQGHTAERDELLRKAAAAAPRDALVQWMALHDRPSMERSDSPPADRVQAVRNLEPDNGFVWLSDLKAAADAKDGPAIDRTLARMAAAKRFDDHRIDYIVAQMKVARRYPEVIENPWVGPGGGIEAGDAAELGVFAMSRVFFGHHAWLGDVCNAAEQCDADPGRFAICAKLGRRLARESATFALRDEGFRVLHESAQMSDDDAADERNLRWLSSQLREQRNISRESSLALIVEGKALWLKQRDDIAVAKTLLAGRGISATPPAGWNPEHDDAL